MDEQNLLDIINAMARAHYPDEFLAYVTLHWQSGARISDLLKIDFGNISENLIIKIDQGKGSNPLYESPIYYREVWRAIRLEMRRPAVNWSRHFFYRVYKKYGIIYKNDDSFYDSVTHAFRKLKVQDIIDNGGTIEDAQNLLGHVDVKNAKYYINSEHRRAVLSRGVFGTVSGEVDPVIITKDNVIRLRALNIRRNKK